VARFCKLSSQLRQFCIITEFLDFVLYLYLEQNITFSKVTVSIDVCCLENDTAVSARSGAVGTSSPFLLEIETNPFSGVLHLFLEYYKNDRIT
jgi:hypothetical protein